MATIYNDVMTVKNAGATGTTALDAKWNGRVRTIVGTTELAAAAQGTIVELAQIPEGAYVMPSSTIHYDALGANSALAIGTVASPALHLASTATTSAGASSLNAIAGITTKYTASTALVATVSGTGAATGTLTSVIQYAWI